MGVTIQRLPQNFTPPEPSISLFDPPRCKNPTWFWVMRSPSFRLPNEKLTPSYEIALRMRHCYHGLLVDGTSVFRIPTYTTGIFESVAAYLAKFLPPSITDLHISYVGYYGNYPSVDLRLELVNQPAVGTLTWLSFLRVAWEFQGVPDQSTRVVCVPDYMAKILNARLEPGHSPIPFIVDDFRGTVKLNITAGEVMRLLRAMRDGAYDKEKLVRNGRAMHKIGKELLGL